MMIDSAELRKRLRPNGTVALGCQGCVYLGCCGGLDAEAGYFDCFAFCDGKCTGCDNVCPESPGFSRRLAEVGGLLSENLPTITQKPALLPVYVPHIHHGSSRSEKLRWPVVSLETYGLFRRDDEGRYRLRDTAAHGVRERFGLDAETKILIRGTAKDKSLETYWAYRRRDGAAEQLAGLGVVAATGPNFSHFLNVPRTDNLFNRKRQLICLAELSEAGISVIPHLSAARPADWRFWEGYLRANSEIEQIAVEFQTGNKNKAEGVKVVEMIAHIQDRLDRRLHPVVVGGGQFVETVAARFATFTLIDSKPFMNTIKRRSFAGTRSEGTWVSSPTPPGAGVGQLLAKNIAAYSALIEARSRPAGKGPGFGQRHGTHRIGLGQAVSRTRVGGRKAIVGQSK